ncbi:MAG: alpha/beta hydrolase [Patulibacter minatonensis]
MSGGARGAKTMVSAILASLLLAVSTSTTGAVTRAQSSTPDPAVVSAAAKTLGASPDPNDIAMSFSRSEPCTSPCFKQGLVYQRTGSALDPEGGIKSYALDVYRSGRTPKRNAPVVVLVHGGGFVEGDRTQMRVEAEALAKAGFLAVSIDHRLVPASRNGGVGIASDADLIPASSEAEADVEKALHWIHRHRATLGAASSQRRYAVGGYSAGAITALRVAFRGGDRSTAKALRWRVGAGFAISGTECGPWAKAYDCRGAYDRADAPVLMFHGEADSIVPLSWGQRTCEAAASRGGGCHGYYYPGQDHFWPNGTIYGTGPGLSKSHPAVLPTVVKFLRTQLA